MRQIDDLWLGKRSVRTTTISPLFLHGLVFRSSGPVESFSPTVQFALQVLGWDIASKPRESDIGFFRISQPVPQRSILDRLKSLGLPPFQSGEISRLL